jgi:hypothetical protein
MVKTVSWAQEAKKFYEENKGKNGIHSFSDALKSPALKKQYKLAKKGGDPDGEDIKVADESSSMDVSDQEPQYDGGNDELAPESAVMDGGNENELTPSMDGGKRKKSARRTKKSKKSKTVKKQRKHKK